MGSQSKRRRSAKNVGNPQRRKVTQMVKKTKMLLLHLKQAALQPRQPLPKPTNTLLSQRKRSLKHKRSLKGAKTWIRRHA